MTEGLEGAAVLTLAGLGLGIAATGLVAVGLGHGRPRERLCLGLIYTGFIGMIALPLVRAFAPFALIHYMPVLLILLLVLPPAFYHLILAKTAPGPLARVPLRDVILPVAGALVSAGFWLLPAPDRGRMFLEGDLPPGIFAAALALATFGLILIWLVASFAYLVAILRQLAAYRARIRQLYSDAEARDMRWVDLVMALLVLIWAVGAVSLADDNLAEGRLFVEELFLALIAGGLMALNIFAPLTPPGATGAPGAMGAPEEAEPDLKYARSASFAA